MKQKQVPQPTRGFSKRTLLLCSIVLFKAASIFATASTSCTSVVVNASATAICPGSAITYTAAVTNAGTGPVYQWYENGNPAGTNSPTYLSTTVGTGVAVYVTVSGSVTCPGDSAARSYSANGNAPAVTTGVTPSTPSLLSSGHSCTGMDSISLASSTGVSSVRWYQNGVAMTPGANTFSIVAGSATGSSGSTTTLLNDPSGIFADGSGHVYVADVLNNRIQKFTVGNPTGTTVAGGGPSGNGATQLNGPKGVFVDSHGNIYVADAGNHRIQRFAAGQSGTPTATTVAGGTQGPQFDQLNYPTSVALYHDSVMYVADVANNRIQMYPLGTTAGTTVAGGTQGSGSDQLNHPQGISLDASGNLYVADAGNGRVQKFTQGSNIGTTVASAGTPCAVYVNGNNIYVADASNSSVTKFTIGNTTGVPILNNLLFNGAATPNGGITGDASGKIYVADGGHNNIRMNVPSGVGPLLSIIPTAVGPFTAAVVNADGCVSAMSSPITFTQTIAPGISLNSSSITSLCPGVTDTLYALVQNGSDIVWSGTGSPINGNTAFLYHAQNLFDSTITATVYNYDTTGCLSSHSAQYVYPILRGPSISISSYVMCSGEVSFTASSVYGGTNPSYTWYQNNTVVGSGLSLDFPNPGTYNNIKCVMVSDVSCAHPTTVTSNILNVSSHNQIPATPTLTMVSGSCGYTALTVGNVSNATSVNWFVNGNPLYSAPLSGAAVYPQSPSGFAKNLLAPIPGTYTVSCANNGCTSATSNSVSIAPPSSPGNASISIAANNTDLDHRTSIIVTSTLSNGGTRSVYTWYKNASVITSVTTSVLSFNGCLGNGDSIYAQVTTTGCGVTETAWSNKVYFTKSGSTAKDIVTFTMPSQVGTSVINSATATVSAVVTTPPAARIAIHPTRLYPSPGATYGPSYAINQNFSHPVTYTVTAADGSTKIWTVTVRDQSGNKTDDIATVNDIAFSAELSVYPDPASYYVILTAAGGTDAAVVTIVDIEGRIMYHEKLPVADKINHMIDLSGYATGTYFAHIAIGDQIQTKQFIVSKQ